MNLLTKEQVAVLWNVSSRTIENYCRKGLLPYIKVGGTIRFDESVLKTSFVSKVDEKKKQVA